MVEHNEAYAQAKKDGSTLPTHEWVGVSFTSSGLVTLDPGRARDLVAYEALWQGPLVDREYRGQRTMSPAVVGDVRRGDPRGWVVGGPGQYPVDAVVTVAADDEARLTTRVDKVLAAAVDPDPTAEADRVALLSWQDCRRREKNKVGIEPFGFRDGVSQPGVRGFTAPTDRNGRREAADQAGSPIIAAGEFVLGYDGEAGSYPDAGRPVPPSWMHDGSFQVLLRLRQDVDGWEAQMRELSASSGGTIDAAATAIGRTADGKPLAALGKGGGLNDFDFTNDQLGDQTPRFAHIRKMNPRNGTFDDRIHRLLRRGIPFATALQVETPPPPGVESVAENADWAGRARSGVQRLHGEHREPVRVPAAELGEQPRLAPAGGRRRAGSAGRRQRRPLRDPTREGGPGGDPLRQVRLDQRSGLRVRALSLEELGRLAGSDPVEVKGEVG